MGEFPRYTLFSLPFLLWIPKYQCFNRINCWTNSVFTQQMVLNHTGRGHSRGLVHFNDGAFYLIGKWPVLLQPCSFVGRKKKLG